jgi:predicted RNA binding protein YcfA (HicA-like mRNA interferase family)
MKSKELISKLLKDGWEKQTGGKHLIMVKGNKRVPIPVHSSKDLPTGTLKSIIKATGLKI